MTILGGFAGGERTRAERDPVVNLAILSGDLNADDVPIDNQLWMNTTDSALHVVRGDAVSASAVLDGFTIRRGSAELRTETDDDTGGNMLLVDASPVIARCVLRDGFASEGGAGVAIVGGAPSFVDCLFQDNRTWNYGAGAMARRRAAL